MFNGLAVYRHPMYWGAWVISGGILVYVPGSADKARATPERRD